jgi:hypothetical protein
LGKFVASVKNTAAELLIWYSINQSKVKGKQLVVVDAKRSKRLTAEKQLKSFTAKEGRRLL